MGVEQRFYKMGEDEMIIFIVAKVVDDPLICGTKAATSDFLKHLNDHVKLGDIYKGQRLKFLWFDIIIKPTEGIEMSKSEYRNRIKIMEATKTRGS